MLEALLLGVAAHQGVSPIPVHVHRSAQDSSARQFESVVVKELGNDRRLSIVADGLPAQVTVTLPSAVGWQRSVDWIRILYQARIEAADGTFRIVKGDCWNWNMRQCGRQIADAVVDLGKDPRPIP